MYVATRKYSGYTRSANELAEQWRTGILPILQKSPGFYDGFLVEMGSRSFFSVTVFQDENSDRQAAQMIKQWITSHLANDLPVEPEVTSGTILLRFTDDRKIRAA